MRKITFPHMGELRIPVKALIQELGQEALEPPKISKKTLDLGVQYSPEFACLPLKINLGNFIEALEMGADTIIMGGGCGPCRFGFYGEVQQELLREMGYQFEMLVLEPDLLEDYRRLKQVFGRVNCRKIARAIYLAIKKLRVLDSIYKMVLSGRASEQVEGEVDRLYDHFLEQLDLATERARINQLHKEYSNLIKATAGPLKKGVEINIGVLGEIYLIIEPFVNLNIEKKLGQLGVIVRREINMSSWLAHFLHLSNEMKLIEKAARGYLRNFIGGHGLDTIGNTVRYARKGYDGIIQVAPFTCMPEIIAQTILPAVSVREGIPVLSLIFDEHTADAGLNTRLEAFVDLLTRKKRKQLEGSIYHEQVLSGG